MTEKDLLHILDDLKDNEFEKFKWYLKYEKVGDIPPIKESKLSKVKMRDVVDLTVQKYKFAGAVRVFKSILEKINRNDLVGKLPNISSGAKERKMSIVVLGTGDLKKSLISLIVGRDVFAQRITRGKIETYENDAYEVTYTPNFCTASEDIRFFFSSNHPDMSLLVVEDEVSTEEVQKQIKTLHETTGKPREEFIVVLPFRNKYEESYPFQFCTMEDLFSKLKELAEDRRLMLTNERQRPADQPQSYMSASSTHMMRTGVRYIKEFFTDPEKSIKGNHSDNRVNLVLLGMSGTGKSASGNTILGEEWFMSRASSMPVTTEWQVEETVINGTRVRVIDTPDIFNDEIESSVKNQHVTKCKELLQSEPRVFLLVMQVGRLTDGERDILRKLEEAFGSEAKEQTVILFTCGEELQRAEVSLEDFLQDCQPDLKNIVEQCDRRCVVFENKATRQHQVTKLMQTVNKMLNKKHKQEVCMYQTKSPSSF